MVSSDRPQQYRRRSRRKVVIALGMLGALAVSACGSGTSTAKPKATEPPTTGANTPVVKELGPGVTDKTIKLGVALVDFKEIRKFTDSIRTNAEQKQIYQLFIDDINKKGGIAGRQIVPIYKYYSPLGTAQILPLCTSFAEDDNVFAVVGNFVDFSGDAQTCLAKQQHRVLMTFNLTKEIIDKSPPGLILTAGNIPERNASILIELLKKEKTLKGKTVAVLGDTTESNAVKDTIVPALKAAGVTLGTPAILAVGTTGNTTAAQSALDSFIEKWKGEHVDAVFLSGGLASTKQFVQKLKAAIPDALLLADNTDVLQQAHQLQTQKVTPNPYEGTISAGGLSPAEYDKSENWKYCSDIYKAATGKEAENAEKTIKFPDGKIDDTYGSINDACQTLTMFHDIGEKVGQYLNNTNWTYTVDNFGPITNRGSGPYSSLKAGKYSADDNFRLQAYDSTLGEAGNWKAVTPLENITGG